MLVASNIEEAEFQPVAQKLQTHACIQVSFHPDRKVAGGKTVAEQLLREGVYRNQFETRISNGSRSAFPGGARFQWEQSLFDRSYDHAANQERPKYGAINLFGFPDGASPRFGSCFLGLRSNVSRRATFTFGDSVTEPKDVGTIDRFAAIWLAILGGRDRIRQCPLF